MIGEHTVVGRSAEPVFTEVDGKVVMMSVAQGMYFALEGVGGRIWALLEQPRSPNELCAVLTDEFEIDGESCLREVLDFLAELHAAQLIRIHNGNGPDSTTERG